MSGMGHMSMGDDVPDLFHLQRMYWAVVGSAIAAATVVNILNRCLAYQRLHDTTLTPSKPKSLFFNTYATLTAIVREASYATLPPWSIRGYTLHFAPLGPVSLILANLVIILVLCFYKLDTSDRWKWEDVGYRTGFIAICQLPLIFLLSGRTNIIGFLSGSSYNRLNWLHRWIARTLWLTATIHMGFWFRNWAQYDYIGYQLRNDPLTQRGFSAWCILTAIVLSSMAPVRRLSYEFFVLQHLVLFVGFLVAIWLHAPAEVKVWVWIPIGLVVFDRVARYAWAAYANLSIFHRSPTKQAPWANRATLTPLPGNVTRVTIENPTVSWKAGQHVFLTCHSLVPLQSHPFTIASIPSDGKMEFLIRAEKGGTRRFFRYALKQHGVLGSSALASEEQTRTVFIDGPYGAIRPLRQFDSVVLLAGGMGATYIMPCLRDIIAGWKESGMGGKPRTTATKRIRVVWVVKSRAQLSWFERELQAVHTEVEQCRREQPDITREVEISVYVTCDEKLEPVVQQTVCLQSNEPTQTRGENPAEGAEKAGHKDDASVRSVTPSYHTSSPIENCCQSGGGCCCCVDAVDEDQIADEICTCSGHAASTDTHDVAMTTAATAPEKPTAKTEPPFHSSTGDKNLNILSGRPKPRNIIRKALEKAEGESAVVVCGPAGLSDEVRRSVVYLSDERAVHKGTGAQGVYLQVEGFGW
ncbi:ferric reductase family protein [Aspergillus candidus]|uniref:ferric-chelate reductase (NADPH) n=1 Tax=Aspergillus candidus TaxID=41067 RepID=A0A2I2FEJ6_ASPCN|nr:metalloreductase [Aspergillus candidus]PLB39019.1 metalloreductase [Aspergillus candidus]